MRAFRHLGRKGHLWERLHAVFFGAYWTITGINKNITYYSSQKQAHQKAGRRLHCLNDLPRSKLPRGAFFQGRIFHLIERGPQRITVEQANSIFSRIRYYEPNLSLPELSQQERS